MGAAEYAAIVLALPIGGWNSYELLEAVQRRASGAPVLVRDEGVSASQAVRLAHSGVYQVLTSGAEAFELIDQAIEDGRRRQIANLTASLS